MLAFFASRRLYRVLYCDATWPPRWACQRAIELRSRLDEIYALKQDKSLV